MTACWKNWKDNSKITAYNIHCIFASEGTIWLRHKCTSVKVV